MSSLALKKGYRPERRERKMTPVDQMSTAERQYAVRTNFLEVSFYT